jgi:ATP-dependent helicase IRC3
MKIEARDYQQTTEERILESYNNKKRRLLVVFSTGMGKTFTAVMLSRHFKKKTLFLVDRKELVHQTKNSFLRFNPDLKVGVELNTTSSKKDCDVVVASIQTLGRVGSKRIKKFNPEEFGLVIVDEAHGSVTESWIRVLSYFGLGPDMDEGDRLLIGMTATPNRTDGVPLGKLYDDIVVNYDLSYGISNGWLTDIELLRVNTNVDISKIKGTPQGFDEEELEKAINTAYRNALIVKSYKEHSDGENAIVFCQTVDHAYQVEALFNENDIPAKCIEAETDDEDRAEWIELYKRGRIKVLVNYGTLTTGFDAPETSTIILARPVKSELLLRQIIGRGLRPSSLCFIDYFKTAKDRLDIIECSIKPVCKIIDLCDVVGNHKIVSVPSLFGLNGQIDLKETTRLFKEVVEPLEEIKHKHQIDISQIVSIDEIDTIVSRKKIDLKSVKVPQEISAHTEKPWLETGDEVYEIFYPKDNKSLIVSKNQIDKWDLLEYDTKTKLTRKLNDFYDLSGAIKIGDDFAREFYSPDVYLENSEWKKKGVTRKQRMMLHQFYKRGIMTIPGEYYEDTGEPVVKFRKTNEILDSGSASVLIQTFINRKR